MSEQEQQSEFSKGQEKETKSKSNKEPVEDDLSEEEAKGVVDYYIAALQKYGEGSGRATRKEFWSFHGCDFIVVLILQLISPAIGLLYGLATFLPRLTVTIRRLHDTGHSGGILLFLFIPIVNIIGAIAILIFFLQDSEADENQYGPNPKKNS